MPHSSKIVTCCYCGSRAALVLRGKERHELSCANCGAPLHEMKMLRLDASADREPVRPARVQPGNQQRSKKKRKKSRSLSQRFLSEFRDMADDILDDVFDVFD